MTNILIIDDQAWIKELCRECLTGEGYNIFATDNIEAVTEDISFFEPHVVLLNQYLKRGFFAWDVLKKIKNRNPKLPVLVVTIHDAHLKCPQLSMADGYVVNSHMAGKELRQKISDLLRDQTSIADEPLTVS